MKLLLVTTPDPWTRSVATVHKWVETGRALGHEVLVYGEANGEMPKLSYTTDLKGVDLALFAVQVPTDFPDMPHLARVLDGIPRERRVVADLWGRYNDTIRIDHDFNHLEKIDGHLGWEWEEAIAAAGSVITQPSLKPLRQNVKPFLFHGFDPTSVAKTHASAKEAAAAWKDKPYGALYVGSNWHRWAQVRKFLQDFGPLRSEIGKARLVGWDWWVRPDWAVQKGIAGVDADWEFLERQHVEVGDGVRFDEVVPVLGQAKFAPVFHRPLFQHLGFVTNRSFETFYADTLPVLMLAPDFVEQVYGAAALKLMPKDGVGAHLRDALKNPEPYWDAVLKTREHLARHHSYARRFEELTALAGAGR